MPDKPRTEEWIWPKWSEPEMRLPEGKTCFDCIRFQGCRKLIGIIAENRLCDWSPSYFVQKAGGE